MMDWLHNPLINTAGGLLWKPIKKATGLTDAQMAGAAGLAVAAPYALPYLASAGGATAAPASAGSAGTAGASAGPSGLFSTFGSAMGAANTGLGVANQMKQLNQTPMVQGAQLQHQMPDFTGLMYQDASANDAIRRKQQQQQVMQGLLGGTYG